MGNGKAKLKATKTGGRKLVLIDICTGISVAIFLVFLVANLLVLNFGGATLDIAILVYFWWLRNYTKKSP